MNKLIAWTIIVILCLVVWFFFFYGIIKFFQECSCETIR